MPWIPTKYYRPGPECTDWRDNVPPHHDPPAKRDYAEVWLEWTKRQLAAAKARAHDETLERKTTPQDGPRLYPAPDREQAS